MSDDPLAYCLHFYSIGVGLSDVNMRQANDTINSQRGEGH
jgi:hypothetical protein